VLTEQQLESIADAASDKSVRKVFAILGVDIDEPSELESFRDNLRFNARLRKAADQSWLAFVGAVTLLVAGALGLGLKRIFLGE
jgi:hypothetical protein